MDDWRTRLRVALAEKGVKVTHLSEELGLNRDYISRLLRPGSNPNIANLQKVCDAIGVSFVYIYTGQNAAPVYDEVVKTMSKMTESELIALRDHLKQRPLKPDHASDDDND